MLLQILPNIKDASWCLHQKIAKGEASLVSCSNKNWKKSKRVKKKRKYLINQLSGKIMNNQINQLNVNKKIWTV